ncbi:hypothetical protein [Roseiflexus castenholzii]|nr:hypothetical protein [Roseiflexus castenholzii]
MTHGHTVAFGRNRSDEAVADLRHTSQTPAPSSLGDRLASRRTRRSIG